jgi:hypothetical protein
MKREDPFLVFRNSVWSYRETRYSNPLHRRDAENAEKTQREEQKRGEEEENEWRDFSPTPRFLSVLCVSAVKWIFIPKPYLL